MTLSERAKRAADLPISDNEHGVVAEGIVSERERLRPLIEALAECADALDYSLRPTREVKTPRLVDALNKLETALTEMEKE